LTGIALKKTSYSIISTWLDSLAPAMRDAVALVSMNLLKLNRWTGDPGEMETREREEFDALAGQFMDICLRPDFLDRMKSDISIQSDFLVIMTYLDPWRRFWIVFNIPNKITSFALENPISYIDDDAISASKTQMYLRKVNLFFESVRDGMQHFNDKMQQLRNLNPESRPGESE